MTHETITALMIAPNLNPIAVQLYRSKSFLLTAVSMDLKETADELNIFSLDMQSAILYYRYASIFNGRVNRKVHNRILGGVFFVVGIKNRKLCSLPPAALEKYRLKFWEPMTFSSTEEQDLVELSADLGALWLDADTM